MKIAIMSGWNLDAGPSVYSEFIGKEFLKMGHKLTVFSFSKESFHGTAFVGKDEDYVIRCFSTSSAKQPFLNPVPFVENDYELFIVQDLGMLPMDELHKIFPLIRRKAKTINVVHDNSTSEKPSFYQFDYSSSQLL